MTPHLIASPVRVPEPSVLGSGLCRESGWPLPKLRRKHGDPGKVLAHREERRRGWAPRAHPRLWQE